MVLKSVFAATICATLLAGSGVSAADEYPPDQFIGLDLSKAVLSPKPLGPAQAFAPVAVEAKSDLSERARVVGTEHARWLEADISAPGVQLINGLFGTLDPGQNLNPGKIISS